MSTISKEMLKDQELMRSTEQAIWDIRFCLAGSSEKSDIRLVLAAYLLSRVTTYNNPIGINYSELCSGDFGLGEDGSLAISEVLSEDEWNRLLTLTEKYSPDVFALAALKCDLSFNARMGSTEATPDSIIQLALRILEISPKDKVADLCCGYGTFLVRSAIEEPEAEYYGYEINTGSKLIAEIRTHMVDDSIKIILKNVFDLLEVDPRQKFDKVFSNYPFRIQLRNLGSGAEFIKKISDEFPGISKATTSDWVFNALMCEVMADAGRAVGIMTNGSTWNSIDTPMRKYFVEKGLVESVIALPARLFSSMSIPTSLIVFSKGNKSVKLVDASKICHEGRRYNDFTEDDLKKIMSALETDCEYSKTVEIEDLRSNEYTLSLSRYLKEGISFKNAVPFETVIKRITRGAPCTARQLDEMVSDEITNMQYLMLANIRDGIIDDNLPYLSYIEPKYEKYCLKDNNLILSKNGYPYKVAIAKIQGGQKILANGNLYIIELDLEKVNPYYLKAFFESEQGIAVLKSITVGATIPNIGVDKLKKVEIPIPSLEEQKRIADRYQTILDEIAIHKLRLEKAISKLHHIFDDESEG